MWVCSPTITQSKPRSSAAQRELEERHRGAGLPVEQTDADGQVVSWRPRLHPT